MAQLPIEFLKISKTTALILPRVSYIMSTDSYQARQILKDERKAGRLVNGAGTQQAKSMVVLDDGTVAASPLSVDTLLKRIELSTYKNFRSKNYSNSSEEKNFRRWLGTMCAKVLTMLTTYLETEPEEDDIADETEEEVNEEYLDIIDEEID